MLAMSIIFTIEVFPQSYESAPCACCGDQELKNLLKGQPLAKIYVHECGVGGAHSLSSSFLKPGGVPPKDKTKDPNFKPSGDPDEAMGLAEEFAMARDQYTCTYAASMLKDGDLKTAWVEGANGNGEGELVIVPQINVDKKVEVYGGFGKSESLFSANNRPKTIKVHILKAEYNSSGQCGTWYDNVALVKSQMVTLQDVNKFQSVSIPSFTRETYTKDNSNHDYIYWLMIEIVDVYPGLKYQDTCITEIKNVE
jgi:hypothetical protein